MNMKEIIWGKVTGIIGSDTLEVAITCHDGSNICSYESRESVRISCLESPENTCAEGVKARELLEKHLLGKELQLTVMGRDREKRLICEIALATGSEKKKKIR